MKVVLVITLIFIGWAFSEQLPEKFVGKWSVERSDNFEEFLEAKGYGWLMRTLIKNSGMTKVFEKSKDGETFTYKILTPTKDIEWTGLQLDKPHLGEYLDDSQHKVTFVYDRSGGRLVEKHENVDDPNEKQDNYSYTIEGEYLVNRLEYQGVVSNRYFKRVE